jgi:hypothetical protein
VFVGIDLAEARRMNFNYVGKIIGPKVRGPLGVCVSCVVCVCVWCVDCVVVVRCCLLLAYKGAYVKHIEAQSRARVQLKGRRSDNPAEQPEDEEEMHLLIIASNKQVRMQSETLSRSHHIGGPSTHHTTICVGCV